MIILLNFQVDSLKKKNKINEDTLNSYLTKFTIRPIQINDIKSNITQSKFVAN